MIRTGQECIDSIRDDRQVNVNGEKVKDVPSHPMFKTLVDIRARIYDMAHDPKTADVMTYEESGEKFAIGLKPPKTEQDWWEKRRSTDAVFEDIKGVVTRVGDETVGEMRSLFDGQDVLNEVDSQFSENIRRRIDKVVKGDPFHVSANTDPKGDRSQPSQEQDPGMLPHMVKETDAGIVVRGAKIRDRCGLCQPGVHQADDRQLGFGGTVRLCGRLRLRIGFAGHQDAVPHRFAGRAPKEDYPLANRFDEVDSLVVFDNVLIPWEDVLFYRHTKAATSIRATRHRYSAFAFVQRNLKSADLFDQTLE